MSSLPHSRVPPREVIAPSHVSLLKEVGRPAGPPPLEYGEVRLWLVANGPAALFAYWEFRPEEHPEAIGREGRPCFLLRVIRNAGNVVELTNEIVPADGKCTVPAQHPDTHYHAELGFFNEQGVWCFLAQSGPARTAKRETPTQPASEERAPVSKKTL
jgi:hypothetical protein